MPNISLLIEMQINVYKPFIWLNFDFYKKLIKVAMPISRDNYKKRHKHIVHISIQILDISIQSI